MQYNEIVFNFMSLYSVFFIFYFRINTFIEIFTKTTPLLAKIYLNDIFIASLTLSKNLILYI